MLYKSFFKAPLGYAFPDGREEARTFMKRLSEVRNRLAHANPISNRQFEQVVCYTGDIIESIKKFYSIKNMNEEYNVPLILKTIDSFGNVLHRNEFIQTGQGSIIYDISKNPQFHLRPGDVFTIEIEVDQSYSEDEYDIEWSSSKQLMSDNINSKKLVISISEESVCARFPIECSIKSKKNWHRLSNGFDDKLHYAVKVLPPI